MFVNVVKERNIKLIEASLDFHSKGELLPDTFVIDLDSLLENAKRMLDEAKRNNMNMYFMMKQLGRNPLIARELINLGFDGAVVVDFKEAKVMMEHNIPISNVGHLVQLPKGMIASLVEYGCEYFTVYSIDKIKEINEAAKKLNQVQKVMIRVVGENDLIYSGQTAGFKLDEIAHVIEEVKQLENIAIQGVTSFPCFLYNEVDNKNNPTRNLDSVLKAVEILKNHGIHVDNINTPSTTCIATIHEMARYGATSGEPGHGLTGTTPLHAFTNQPEIPCVLYLSEISHNFNGNAYCYGGGFYRRSHVENALVSRELVPCKVIPPTLDSIDYHFGLSQIFKVTDPVIMAFRFQIFVTRSDMAIISGLNSNKPKIVGRFNSLGDKR